MKGFGGFLTRKLHLIMDSAKEIRIQSLPMNTRLFLFRIVLVFTIIMGAVFILLVSGVFTAGLSHDERLVRNDLACLTRDINISLQSISKNTVAFSKSVSESIETQLLSQGKDVSDLKNDPELIDSVLTKTFGKALLGLLSSKSSGVVIILDGTMSPIRLAAEIFKAGLYLKDMEPTEKDPFIPNIQMLKGYPDIALDNPLPLHAKWSPEFDIRETPYYKIPIQATSQKNLPISDSYYWTPPFTMDETNEQVILCVAPLIDSKGNVFGISGFEVDSTFFSQSYPPRNTKYSRTLGMLFTQTGGVNTVQNPMLSGKHSPDSDSIRDGTLGITNNKKSFSTYQENKGEEFLGFHNYISLYPQGSPFLNDRWAVAVIIPKGDIVNSVSRLNLVLSSLIIILLVIGIVLSLLLSRGYTKPIFQGIDKIRPTGSGGDAKTNIRETGGSVEFPASQNRTPVRKKGQAQQQALPPMLSQFMDNINTLSPAERDVFDLYAQNYTAKEIADTLSISINTVKTHTGRIYSKIDVSSRKELILYINMLRDFGQQLV
jgi:DNA-binding CsgD family transcriptional regulator